MVVVSSRAFAVSGPSPRYRGQLHRVSGAALPLAPGFGNGITQSGRQIGGCRPTIRLYEALWLLVARGHQVDIDLRMPVKVVARVSSAPQLLLLGISAMLPLCFEVENDRGHVAPFDRLQELVLRQIHSAIGDFRLKRLQFRMAVDVSRDRASVAAQQLSRRRLDASGLA